MVAVEELAVERVAVPFEGDGAGVGELTWAQRGFWKSIVSRGSSLTIGGIMPVLAGRTVADVAATLRLLTGRHQALRTRLLVGDGGRARQQVFRSGEAALEVVDAGATDPATVAAAVKRRYETTTFDYEHEWPLRMAVVRQGGRLTHVVAVYLHTALDAHGLAALTADLANLRAGGERPEPVTAIQPIQPIELAEQQRTPAARRQCAASLRHLEGVLRAVPPLRFAERPGDHPDRYVTVEYTSPASLLAARAVAAAGRLGTSQALLGALAVTLARLTGGNPVMVMLLVSNRFRPRFAGSVCPLAQAMPCAVEVAGVSLGEVARLAWRSAMRTYKHAYYEPELAQQVVDRVGAERGVVMDLSCYFNDRRPPEPDGAPPGPPPEPAAIQAALPLAGLRRPAVHDPNRATFYLDVDAGSTGGTDALVLSLTVNTRFLAEDTAAAVLRTIEHTLVDTTIDPSTPTGIARDPGADATAAK